MMKKNQKGFSLIELLITVVIVSIVSAIAVIGYNAVVKGTRDTVQTARLLQYVDAQNKFRTVKGKRRYATFEELCREKLLNESVAKFGEECKQMSIDGWVITPGDESTEFLREHFFATLSKEDESKGGGTSYCIGADAILRKAAGRSRGGTVDADSEGSAGGGRCTLESAPVEP